MLLRSHRVSRTPAPRGVYHRFAKTFDLYDDDGGGACARVPAAPTLRRASGVTYLARWRTVAHQPGTLWRRRQAFAASGAAVLERGDSGLRAAIT